MPTSQDELMRALYDEHVPALWGFALKLTSGDRVRSQDVVQEVLLRAWRHPRVLDQSNGSARAWLFTVARRIVIDEWRARRTRSEFPTADPPEEITPDQTDQTVQSWMVAAALRKLSPEHRQALVECFYLGRTVPEAAARLGVPPGTIKSRTHYGLRALKLALEEMGVIE